MMMALFIVIHWQLAYYVLSPWIRLAAMLWHVPLDPFLTWGSIGALVLAIFYLALTPPFARIIAWYADARSPTQDEWVAIQPSCDIANGQNFPQAKIWVVDSPWPAFWMVGRNQIYMSSQAFQLAPDKRQAMLVHAIVGLSMGAGLNQILIIFVGFWSFAFYGVVWTIAKALEALSNQSPWLYPLWAAAEFLRWLLMHARWLLERIVRLSHETFIKKADGVVINLGLGRGLKAYLSQEGMLSAVPMLGWLGLRYFDQPKPDKRLDGFSLTEKTL